MKCKTFNESNSTKLEAKINDWLESSGGNIVITHSTTLFKQDNTNLMLLLFYTEK